MGLLEDEVRAAFANEVVDTPALEDVASRAIWAANRMRTRQAIVGAAACLLAVAMVGSGVAIVYDHYRTPVMAVGLDSGPVRPQPLLSDATQSRLPVDVLVAGRIQATDGSVVAVDLPQAAERVWRVTGGWLVQTGVRALADLGSSGPSASPGNSSSGHGDSSPSASAAEAAAVYYVTSAHAPVKLGEGSRVAVQAVPGTNGQDPSTRIAVAQSGRVTVATYANGNLTDVQQTGGVGSLGPIGFVAGGVLLGSPAQADQAVPAVASGVNQESFDMWFPARGDYRPGPRSTDHILGPTGDGRQLFALIARQAGCLGVVDPATFVAKQQVCRAAITAADAIVASPDGRWLLAYGGSTARVFDLAKVWSNHQPVATLRAASVNAMWLNGSFVLGGVGEIVVIDPTKPDQPARLAVPQASGSVSVIPPLPG